MRHRLGVTTASAAIRPSAGASGGHSPSLPAGRGGSATGHYGSSLPRNTIALAAAARNASAPTGGPRERQDRLRGRHACYERGEPRGVDTRSRLK
jgi:hypothetical protein